MLKQLICVVALTFVLASAKELRGKAPALAIQNTIANFESLSITEQTQTINELVDLVMEEMRHIMTDFGMDPLGLPDIYKNFSYKPIIITYHGELELTKGWANDVSEFYRNGDAKLDYTNRNLTVEVAFKFNEILFNYDYLMKLMGLGPEGGVEGSAKDVDVFFSLVIDFENLLVSLQKFDIVKIGKIKCKFTDNGLIDWIVNLLSGICIPIFKNLITWIVEGVARGILHDICDLVNGMLANLKPQDFAKIVPNQIIV